MAVAERFLEKGRSPHVLMLRRSRCHLVRTDVLGSVRQILNNAGASLAAASDDRGVCPSEE